MRDDERESSTAGGVYFTYNENCIREHNRNELVEYGRKVVDEHKDEFVSIDEL